MAKIQADLRPKIVTWLLTGAMFLIAASLSCMSVQAQANPLDECDREEMENEEYQACLSEKRTELQAKIRDSQQQAQTLTNAINIINSQVLLQQIQIAQTQNEIRVLEKEVNNLNERIDGLSLSLDRLTDILIVRVQASYKQNRTSPIIALFTTGSFSDFITQYKYLQQAERQIARAMQEAENQRQLYDEQKNLKEVKQAQLEEKRTQLQAQHQELERNKGSKQKLLTETKNDEVTYQRLLAEAERELASFSRFVTAQFGSSYCMESPAPQPDGMFLSQRDSRWCNTGIGNSRYSIGAVGCLITSTAMIWQHYGHGTTPVQIARDPNNFVLNTASMRNPLPAPPGYTYTRYDGQHLKVIDEELSAGRPVIVRVAVTFNQYATHFIVLKSGSNGKYVMNDPLYQADLPFESKYSIGQITSVRTFTPS